MVTVIDRTEVQQLALNIIPRIAAVISLCCALHIIMTVLRSKYYRNRIYHRIMLGCAINIIIHAGVLIWGTAALPVVDSTDETSITLGAAGNTTTCSVSGFLHYYAIFVTPLYYVTLSFLSVAAFRNKFDFSKFAWIEKWIHIGVYIFPLSSATYLLSIEAFNPMVNGCRLVSVPLGCGDQFKESSGEEEDSSILLSCERGPQNIGQLQMLFWGIPIIILFVFPMLVMIMLYLHVRSQGTHPFVALSVARQSAVYILILVLIYSFSFCHMIIILGMGKYLFVANILANTNEALIGMYFLAAYRYFRSEDPTSASQDTSSASENDDDDMMNNDKATRRRFSETSSHSQPGSSSSMSRASAPKFSIFDGNQIPEESPWAAFLTEGEDEDYETGRVWQQ